jgi:hypothetical protein
MVTLTRERIEEALEALDTELATSGTRATIYVVGGAAMALVYRARETTRDVDAWFSEPAAVRQAARRVAERLGLPEDWLNDAAKAFVPAHAGFERWRASPHLDVLIADARTPLAMKCAAARSAEDAADIRVLASHLAIDSVEGVLSALRSHYPEEQLSVRSRLLIEEMFS